ncbi:hypothetical protein GE118_01890 [Mycoplasma sp. NEAQ87857]|uniref:SLAC1 family transporter n=1 Tax=Mycoplasma sp. NEAQ87857 TaxID=2683967 RepID=UPI001316E4C5|nr:hypothetical protein [Mycoplasma sp. NEAQ87857]QGZ97547.1 hypothetical protein GE118_01890 [Mycoplasma sp. NEAQ87857]
MSCSFWNKIKSIPLALNAVGLGTMGIATTGTFIVTTFFQNNFLTLKWYLLALQIFCIAFCIFYVSLIFLRYFSLKITQLKKEIKDPESVGSVGVTLLCLCILSNSFGWIYTNFLPDNQLRYILFIITNIHIFIAISLQLIYLVFFLKNILFKPKYFKNEAYASWFVPLVGLAISVAYINNLDNILPLWYWQSIWWLGFIIFAIMYPLVLYKFLFKPHQDHKNIPSMAIYASPANMLSVGFLVAFDPERYNGTIFNYQPFYQIIAIILFCWAALSVCLYLSILIKSLKLHQYSFSWTSLTFPASVSATGTIMFGELFFQPHMIYAFYALVIIAIMLFITSLSLVIFVNIKYINKLINIFFKGKQCKTKMA